MWQALVLALTVGAHVSTTPSDRGAPAYTRVRSMNPYVAALVREGYERSAAFRSLVDTLQQSNATVIVQPGICAGGRIRSCLVAVAGSMRERQIRITVDPRHTIRNGLIAAVGHELQHAVEIAEHPEVIDAATAVALYRQMALGRCGQGLSEECETERALETERAVLRELLR
jgi:hypothetical protein